MMAIVQPLILEMSYQKGESESRSRTHPPAYGSAKTLCPSQCMYRFIECLFGNMMIGVGNQATSGCLLQGSI